MAKNFTANWENSYNNKAMIEKKMAIAFIDLESKQPL